MLRGIIYIDENYAEFGYFPESHDNIRIIFEGTIVYGISYEKLKEHLGFDYNSGMYVLGKDVNKFCFPFGRESFPYNLDRHVYNMKFEENLFKGRQKVDETTNFKFIDELPYTFGLEFETAGGFLPQHQLYELGLIPLRDGSISGIEFSTVVLQGNLGLNLLKKQVERLDQTTVFDKDCSLHIHFGNFQLNGDVLLSANNLFVSSNIVKYVPDFTFNTTMYKTNTEKNYCGWNNRYRSFGEMYQYLVGRPFYGDFSQPHPKDLTGTRKWCIKSRYKAVNFINAVCYDGPKTIEYRFLRPSYNLSKIIGWLFIFAAFIKYAEQNSKQVNIFYRKQFAIDTILKSVYSPDLSNILCDFLDLLEKVVIAQHSVRDYHGMRTDIEDKIINYNTFGYHFY